MIYSYSEKGYQIQNVNHMVGSFMPLKDMRIMGAHFNEHNKLFLISIS